MKSNNILIYCPVFYPQTSGYSSAFVGFIRAILLNNEDLLVSVVTQQELPRGYSELQIERLKIFRVKSKFQIPVLRYFYNDFHVAISINKLMQCNSHDLLFFETMDKPIILMFLNKFVLNRTIVRLHSTSDTEYTFFSRRPDYVLRKYLLRYFVAGKLKWIAATNKFHIDFIKRNLLLNNPLDIANKVFFVLPNVIDVPSNELNINRVDVSKLRMICLGRMDELGANQKGFVDLIIALRLLSEDVRERFEIFIIGDGSERLRLERLADGLQNVSFIHSMGRDEVLNNLREADVVVLPSRYEGLSMFALEGLVTGNVCLFSRTGGLVDLIKGNGYLFEVQNIEGLKDALIKITECSSDEIQNMKMESVFIANLKFSPSVVSEKFYLILSIVKSNSAFL